MSKNRNRNRQYNFDQNNHGHNPRLYWIRLRAYNPEAGHGHKTFTVEDVKFIAGDRGVPSEAWLITSESIVERCKELNLSHSKGQWEIFPITESEAVRRIDREYKQRVSKGGLPIEMVLRRESELRRKPEAGQ